MVLNTVTERNKAGSTTEARLTALDLPVSGGIYYGYLLWSL